MLIHLLLWNSLEHWKAFTSSAKASKKKAKGVTEAIIHPNESKEKRREAKERAKEEEEARNAVDSPESKSGPSSKVEEAKLIALRKRVEKMKKEEEEEDEQWKSSGQWRWEVITGRQRQSRKEGEQKWKDAMESRDHTSSTSGKQTVGASKKTKGNQSTASTSKDVEPQHAAKSKMHEETLAKQVVHTEPPAPLRAGDSGYTSPSTEPVEAVAHEDSGTQKQEKETDPTVRSGTPEERPPAYEQGESISPGEKPSR